MSGCSRFHLAFWFGCFAVLMMHLGPLVSGVQGVLSPEKPFLQQIAVQHEHDAEAAIHVHMEHDNHHALMGHRMNPHLPDWVNNLKMCGYCELMILSPILILAVLFILLAPPKAHVVVGYRAVVHISSCDCVPLARAPPVLPETVFPVSLF